MPQRALAKLRAHKREELPAATEANLAKIQQRVHAGKLQGADAIGLRVGRIAHLNLAFHNKLLPIPMKIIVVHALLAVAGFLLIAVSAYR